MRRTVSDLEPVRDDLIVRRTRAAYALIDNFTEENITKLAVLESALASIEKLIASGSSEPDQEKSVYETRGLLTL